MSFPAYPEYKDSGVPWLGKVPGHWVVAALKRKTTLTTTRADQRIFPVALENIEGWTGRFLPSESEFEGEGVAFLPGDILYGKLRPYLAKVLVAARSGEAIGDFHVIRPVCQCPEYLSYLLRARELVSVVDGSTYGSKMPRASWDFLGALAIGFPPLPEQIEIAAFLDRETAKIDALVAEQERLIALLKEKRQAVISHAVTKGLNPDAPMKDSGIEWLGEIPAHWEVPKAKHFVMFSGGGTPSRDNPLFWNGEIPWVSPKDMKSELIRDSEEHITEAGLTGSASSLIMPGAVLIVVRSGILRHTIPVAINAVPVTLNQDMKALRLEADRCEPGFLFRWIQGLNDELLLAWSKQGATVESIEHQYLAETIIPLPPIAEQRAIMAFLDGETERTDLLVAEAQSAIKLLQERRAALISAAVTGKIDVRELATTSQESELA